MIMQDAQKQVTHTHPPFIAQLRELDHGERVRVGDFYRANDSEPMRARERVGMFERYGNSHVCHYRVVRLVPADVVAPSNTPKDCAPDVDCDAAERELRAALDKVYARYGSIGAFFAALRKLRGNGNRDE